MISDIVQFKIPTSFAKGSVNAYLLLGNPVTLVDTGIPGRESALRIKEGLASVSLSWRDVKQIVITHMHLDHTGGVEAIQKETDAPVYVHERAGFALRGGRTEFERTDTYLLSFFESCGAGDALVYKHRYRETSWKNVRYVADGDTVSAGGRHWNVIYVPGHSQTDICLWDPVTGDVMVGDFLLKDISANAFIAAPDPPAEERPKPLLQLRESFRRVYGLPFRMVYPGHGVPFTGHCQLIDQRFAEQAERCEQILRLLHSGPRTVYEISCQLFPWLKQNQLFLGLSEVQGHLDLLVEQSRVYVERRGKINIYRVL
ncbi:MBL fold metallo-hydrolase [Lihuaxuella thermophila]|uniref:Glyoxylase, beta-lactamase superfamily II n=1 Tax=Lihuaxuella thermophila TaxID=1173111 RepID=A0A1H8GGH7_9BACL|nr:MBL fold metallo-hydrolase [Lihuaxuella thermophila]SEN42885.1 Glyoxylase, beta-lactamase superfamily II [Lihuaxuella thermophila]